MTEPDMTTTRPLRHPSPRQLPPDAMPRPTLGTARSVRAWTAPLVLLLAACGGGQDAGTGVTQGAAAAARSAPDATRHTLNTKAQALRASGLSSAEVARQLLDYAESVFKDYFPGHPATQSLPPFLYRAYANGVYLGVTSGGDLNYPDGVWLMGGPFGPAPQRVGAVTDFITPVAAGTSIVTGMLYAPVGTQVVLQSNGGDDLAVVVPPFPGGTDPYNSQAFRFTVPLPDSSHYQVTIKSQPAGMVCRVYQDGNGVLPIAAEAVKVGCEYDTDLVSRSTDNQSRGSYYDSSAPVIGGAAVPVGHTADGYGEGRFVAFVSSASGLGGATGSRRQIFWRDRLTGDTVLISTGAGGVEGNGDSFAPAISADGLTVVFESYASNLVAGDTNGVRDVFLWSALNREQGLQRVSVGAGGVPANAESYEPTVSGDGRVVAFSSGASNLSTGVSGINTINVYKRDLVSGTTTLVTRGINNLGVGGSRPMLSEDGSRLVFYSFASNLVLGDNNNLWDIFVHDQPAGASSGTLKRFSLTAGGGERNQGNESASRVVAPAISGDGRTVAFATTASNMVSGDTNGLQDVFTVDVASGAVQRASVTLGGVQGNADTPSTQGERPTLSYDGTWVAFSTSASNLGAPAGNVLARNMATGQLVALSKQNGSSVGAPMLSRNAAYVAFGAGTALDPRFTGSGLFVRYTGADRAWWWLN